MKIFFLIIFLLSFTLSSFCEEELNAFFLKRYSENQKYYVVTSMSADWTDSNYYGNTFIRKSDNDSVLYKIEKYFDSQGKYNHIFISNDGLILFFITNDYSNNNKEKKVIKIFHKGKLEKTFDLNLFVSDDDKENVKKDKNYFQFYQNIEIRKKIDRNEEYWVNKRKDSVWIENDEEYIPNSDSNLIIADKYPTFVHNDTLFIISNNLYLYKIDFKTLKVDKSKYLGEAKYIRKIANQNKIIKKFYHFYQNSEILDEDLLCDFFADSLKMKSTKGYSILYKYYDLVLNGYISRKDSIFHITFLKKDSSLPNIDYQKLLNSYKFDVKFFNEFSDKWYFELVTLSFRNTNDSIAKFEKSRENKIKDEIIYSNAFKDTINGEYIPKDLYDAMSELDKRVSDKNKIAIKEISNTKELLFGESDIRFSIRFNWELWHNSRIANYLKKHGIRHPEDMGCTIDCAYWNYLRDSSYFLVNFDNVKFKFDSNLIVQIIPSATIDSKRFSIKYCKKILEDINEKKYLYSAFSKSELEDYLYWNEDSTESNFVISNSDFSINSYIDSLKNTIYDYGDTHIPLDSSLFIEIADWNFISFTNKFFAKIANNNKIIPVVESWQIVKNINKNELDSLDNIFLQINKKMKDNESNTSAYSYSSEKVKVFLDFILMKKMVQLNIIRFYPLIEFDFKKYKQEKKK